MEKTAEQKAALDNFKKQFEKVGLLTDKKDIFYMKDEKAFAFKPFPAYDKTQVSFVSVTSVTDEKLAQMKKDGIEPAIAYKDGHGYNCCLIKTTLSTELQSQRFSEKLNEIYGVGEKLDNHLYFPADLAQVQAAKEVKSYSKNAFESMIEKVEQKNVKEKTKEESYNKDEHNFKTAQQDYGTLEDVLEVLDTYKNKQVEKSLEQKKEVVQDKTKETEQIQDKSEAQSQDKAEDKDKEKEQTQDKTVEEKKLVVDKEQTQTQEQAQAVTASNTNILHQILELLKDIITALKNVVVSQKAVETQDKTVEKQEKSPEQKIQQSLADKEVAQTIDQIPAAPAHSKDAEIAPETQPKNYVQEKAQEVEKTKQAELANEREAKAQAKAQQKTQSPKKKKSQDLSV